MPYRPLTDTEIPRPQFLILKASAGSGKTYELTRRFVQLYLSDSIPRSSLNNIIAITFSNNAANEMKERILKWLKGAALKEENALRGLSEVLSMRTDEISRRAEEKIMELLDNYQDLQVRTIDSFMTGLFRATATEQGMGEAFEVSFEEERIMEYAFDLFLRKATDDKDLKAQILEAVDKLTEDGNAFVWDPTEVLKKNLVGLFKKVASSGIHPQRLKYTEGVDERLTRYAWQSFRRMKEIAEKNGLSLKKRANWPEKILEAEKHGDIKTLVEKTKDLFPYTRNKGQGYHEAFREFEDFKDLVAEVAIQWSSSFWSPYIKTYLAMERTLEEIKQAEGVVFLEDIGLKLKDYIDTYQVTDLYFFLGEVLNHWLIDEFQDTSPVQWQVLNPLIENALSQGGTFMLVGDIKQAIYGYRNADYRIMKSLAEGRELPSVNVTVKRLDKNRRSTPEIVEFSKGVFRAISEGQDADYAKASKEVGLDSIEQVSEEKRTGYVEVQQVKSEDLTERLPGLVKDLKMRGFSYDDIAILAQRNDQVIEAVAILNRAGIPVISFSSLDARKTKVVSEIFSLLRFLDEPTNHMAFGEFILGEVFQKATGINRQRLEALIIRANDSQRPLYKAFQEEFPEEWEALFSEPYRLSGYLPLYDLLVYIYQSFDLFERFHDEQAPLLKVLEVAMEMEQEGISSIGDFLDKVNTTPPEAGTWDIKTTPLEDAVRAMTIHKAKGLGFRVVILLLMPQRSGYSNDPYYIRPEPEGVSIYKLNEKVSKRNETLREVYEESRFLRRVNELNTLYVGLTRAKEQMYVLKIYRDEKELERFPLRFIPEISHTGTTGPPSLKERKKADRSLRINPSPYTGIMETEDRKIYYIEKKRGEMIHKLLQNIRYSDDLDTLQGIEGGGYLKESDIKTIKDTIQGLKRYFEKRPDREVLTEVEFVDHNGRTYRIDRLVVEPSSVTVVEYKTGEPEKQHTEQLKRYLSIIKRLYADRTVSGVLVYLDHGIIKEIS